MMACVAVLPLGAADAAPDRGVLSKAGTGDVALPIPSLE